MRIVAATFAAAAVAALTGTPATAQSSRYRMANPAATYCAEIGGRSVNHYDSDGGARGFCRLPNGREVDEWQLYRDRGHSGDRSAYDDRRGYDDGRDYDDRRASYGDAAARSCRGGGGRYYIARPTTGGAERGWCRTRDGRIWDAWQLYDRLGGDTRWDDRNDGYRDYSYQQQYRSWDDRSDRQYDNRDDDDRDYRYNDDRDDQSYGDDDDRSY